MYQEHNHEHVEENLSHVFPFAGNTQPEAMNSDLYSFIKSFEGLYIEAGRDEKKQIKYCVRQVLKQEGFMFDSKDELPNIITQMIMDDPLMLETVRLVIQRYAK